VWNGIVEFGQLATKGRKDAWDTLFPRFYESQTYRIGAETWSNAGNDLALLKQIRNEELTASDIPSPGAFWDDVRRFAGSFDAYKVPQADHYQKLWWKTRMDFLAGKKEALKGLDLSDLRAVLFLHWRALRHGYSGSEPPSSEMVYTWDLIDAIRRKVGC
jgi:hypothetical protein